MNTKEAIMGDLEYLMRDGLEDSRALTQKGIRINKKVLRNALLLLERGEADSKELKKVWKMWKTHKKEITYLSADANYKGAKILMDRCERKYFPKEE